MKKVISLICLLFCVATVFTGCIGGGKTMSTEEFYEDYEYVDEYPTLKSYSKLNDLSELVYRTSTGEIIVFVNKDNKKLKFYDALSETFVLNLDKDYVKEYTIVSACQSKFIITVEQDENKSGVYYTKLYDCKGNHVATKNGYTDSYNLSNLVSYESDLMKFNGSIYRVDENGGASLVVSNPFFGNIPNISIKTEKYYYVVDYDEVTVYSHDLEEVLHWEAPSSDCEAMVHITSEDCILAQIMEVVPDSEKKYDVVYEGKKCNIKSKIINVTTGKEKDVKLDYVINQFAFARNRITDGYDDYDMIPEKIDNIAFIYEIKDKRVLSSDKYMKCVSLNGENGKILCELFTDVDNMPAPFVNDRYKYYSDNGNTILIDGEGKYIGRIDGLSSDSYNETYIIKNGKIYDFSLNVKYDYTEDDKVFVKLLGHGVLLKDDENYFIYTRNGELKTLDGNLTVSNCSEQLIVTYKDGKYNFYDEDCNSLGSISCGGVQMIYVENEKGICIVSTTNGTETTYYKFTK